MVRKIIEKAHESAKKAREKSKKFKKEFRNQATVAVIAAFGFLIALSWRDFISDTVNKIVLSLGVYDQLYIYKLFSAILITIIAIFGIMIASKFKINEETKQK